MDPLTTMTSAPGASTPTPAPLPMPRTAAEARAFARVLQLQMDEASQQIALAGAPEDEEGDGDGSELGLDPTAMLQALLGTGAMAAAGGMPGVAGAAATGAGAAMTGDPLAVGMAGAGAQLLNAPVASAPGAAGTPRGNAQVVAEVARRQGVDPVVAVAMMLVESGGNERAVGDSGTSFGLFQLHEGGMLTAAGLTPGQAFDPRTNATVAMRAFAHEHAKGPGRSAGVIAAASQRPADPAGYAAKVEAALGRARQLLQ